MRPKQLHMQLSSIDHKFKSPKITLEQYSTSPELATSILATAASNNDIGEGIVVCDLGCGTGILSIGAAILECEHVISIDVCPDALEQATQNAIHCDVEYMIDFLHAEVAYTKPNASYIEADLLQDDSRGSGRNTTSTKKKNKKKVSQKVARKLDAELKQEYYHYEEVNDTLPLCNNAVDTVLTNPPFGTKHNPGIDIAFLASACRLARRAVYSYHKASTQKFILKKLTEEWRLDAHVIAQMKFEIPNMYKFHSKKCVDVDVVLIKVSLLQAFDESADVIPSTPTTPSTPVTHIVENEEGHKSNPIVIEDDDEDDQSS